jgi:hypothetical protein
MDGRTDARRQTTFTNFATNFFNLFTTYDVSALLKARSERLSFFVRLLYHYDALRFLEHGGH